MMKNYETVKGVLGYMYELSYYEVQHLGYNGAK